MLSSASVAVFGNVTVFSDGVTTGRFSESKLRMSIAEFRTAFRRRRDRLRPFAEYLREIPTGRQVERQIGQLQRRTVGRLGVLSTATRLVSRVTSWCSSASARIVLSASSGLACRKVRATSASSILRRAQSFERPVPSAALAIGKRHDPWPVTDAAFDLE